MLIITLLYDDEADVHVLYCTVSLTSDCEAQRGGTITVFALEIPSSGGPLRVLKYTPHLQPVDVKHRSC